MSRVELITENGFYSGNIAGRMDLQEQKRAEQLWPARCLQGLHLCAPCQRATGIMAWAGHLWKEMDEHLILQLQFSAIIQTWVHISNSCNSCSWSCAYINKGTSRGGIRSVNTIGCEKRWTNWRSSCCLREHWSRWTHRACTWWCHLSLKGL